MNNEEKIQGKKIKYEELEAMLYIDEMDRTVREYFDKAKGQEKEAEDPNTKYYSHEEFKQMASRLIDGK